MVFIFRLLSRLPLWQVHVLGGLLGRLVYLLSPTYRRHLRENLAQGGFPASLRQTVAAETGKQMLELSKIWLRTQEEANAQVVEVVGWDLVEAACQSGSGIIFLSPHLGCFEIAGQYLSAHFPLTCMYRPPKRAVAQYLIETGRRRAQLHLAPADVSGVRTLVKALKRNQAIALLPDQAPKNGEGSWLDFFGRPAYTMTLAARLTETGATTLMTWGERLPDGRGFRLHFSLPQQTFSGNTVERAAQINREVEHLICLCPTQYLWGYNRYKQPTGAEPPPASGEGAA